MRKIFKRMLTVALSLSFVFSSFTGVTFADANLRTFGDEETFTTKYEKLIADDSVIMRIDSRDCIVKNHRKLLEEGFEKLRPYLKDNVAMIPVQTLLAGFGFEFEKGDDYISFKVGDKEYTAKNGEKLTENSKVNCELFQMRIMVDAEEAASILGKFLYNDNDLLVFSDTEKQITPSQASTIKETLAWEWGPMFMGSEGFCCAIIENVKNPVERYVRTDVGGMYRWIPEAQRWQQLCVKIPGTYGYVAVYGFAVDPNNAGTLYAACGAYDYSAYHRVLKSTDYGITWTETSLNKIFLGNSGHSRYMGECLQVDPNNSNRILCGTPRDGLWMSDDAGETWYQNETIPNVCAKNNIGGPHTIVYDYDSPVVNGNTSVIYLSNYTDGVYKSTDGGDTFKKIEGSPEVMNRGRVVDGKLYAATSNIFNKSHMSGLYIYDGKKWENITPTQLPENDKNVGGIMIDRTNKNFIVALGHPYMAASRTGYRSFDGGKTWEQIAMHGWNGCDLWQDPEHPEMIWFPHGRGLSRFMDIYAENPVIEWGDEGIEMLVTDKVVSLPAKDAPKMLLACWDRGYEFSDRVDTRAKGQVDVGSGTHFGNVNDIDYCESDPSIVFAVTREHECTVLKMTDYGRTPVACKWDKDYAPHQVAVGAVKQANGWPIVMVEAYKKDYSEAFIFRSKDGGETWDKLDNNGVIASLKTVDPSLKCLAADRVNPNVFYWCSNGMYNNGDGFFTTKDGGDTWSLVSDPKVVKRHSALKAVPNREGMVWLRGDDGLYVSTSYGSAFKKLENVEDAIRFGFGKGKDGSDMPAAYMYGKIKGDTEESIYISDDLGETWRKIGHGFVQYAGSEDMTGDGNVYGRCYITTSGCGVWFGQAIDVDDHGPLIEMENKSTSDEYGFDYALDDPNVVLKGKIDEHGEVRINNEPVSVNTDGKFEKAVTLSEGENTFRVEAVDVNGNKADPVYVKLRYIPQFFAIEYTTDKNILTKVNTVTVSGSTSTPAEVHVGDTVVYTDEENKFTAEVKISGEREELKAYAISENGAVSPEETFVVEYDYVQPVIEMTEVPSTSSMRFCLVKGKVSEKGRVRVNDKDIVVRDDLTFNAFCSLENGNNSVKVQAKDIAGNVGKPLYYNIKCDAVAVDTTKFDVPYRTDIVFDGNVDEWTLDKRPEKLLYGTPNNICDFSVAWDDTYLYVGVKVVDDVIYTGHETAWTNDAIEIYYDGLNDKATKFDGNDKQLVFVAGTSGENHISKITDDGYTMEVRIPFADLKCAVENKTLIGFDLDMVDNDNLQADHTRDGGIVFNGTNNNYANTSAYATIKLVGKEN